MRYGAIVAVILGLMLTGTGLAVARGTVLMQGQMVLCKGSAVIVVPAQRQGQDGKAEFCPDMAPSLLTAIAPAVTPLLPRPDFHDPWLYPGDGTFRTIRIPAAMARDPPAGARPDREAYR